MKFRLMSQEGNSSGLKAPMKVVRVFKFDHRMQTCFDIR
jgi:hypothetical protein